MSPLAPPFTFLALSSLRARWSGRTFETSSQRQHGGGKNHNRERTHHSLQVLPWLSEQQIKTPRRPEEHIWPQGAGSSSRPSTSCFDWPDTHRIQLIAGMRGAGKRGPSSSMVRPCNLRPPPERFGNNFLPRIFHDPGERCGVAFKGAPASFRRESCRPAMGRLAAIEANCAKIRNGKLTGGRHGVGPDHWLC